MSNLLSALGIDRMTPQERLDLIEQIWDSLPVEVTLAEIPEWHRAELTRRRADLQNDNRTGTPWREVLEKLDPPS